MCLCMLALICSGLRRRRHIRTSASRPWNQPFLSPWHTSSGSSFSGPGTQACSESKSPLRKKYTCFLWWSCTSATWVQRWRGSGLQLVTRRSSFFWAALFPGAPASARLVRREVLCSHSRPLPSMSSRKFTAPRPRSLWPPIFSKSVAGWWSCGRIQNSSVRWWACSNPRRFLCGTSTYPPRLKLMCQLASASACRCSRRRQCGYSRGVQNLNSPRHPLQAMEVAIRPQMPVHQYATMKSRPAPTAPQPPIQTGSAHTRMWQQNAPERQAWAQLNQHPSPSYHSMSKQPMLSHIEFLGPLKNIA
mmetsp:Transcript_258/g.316  ORF Transcript_258/g.316 Transcript_258/m.316 type:complete len:304 (+) Transcript_258:935-1846(+)